MSRPHSPEDRNSPDLTLSNQTNTDNSLRTSDVDHDQDRIRTGLAAAPAEVIHLVCRLLCLCSYCEPNPNPLELSPLNPVRFRDDLDAFSKTCKFVRDVAQPYLFHVFGPNDRERTRRLSLKLSVEIPHVADQIRRIALDSLFGELSLLNRLTGLQTLRVIARNAGKTGLERQLSFPCLKELCYGPGLDTVSVVHMEDARKDLRAILSAAENLSHLRCHNLRHKSSTTPFIFLWLPACKITTLRLHQCWLPHETFKRFMANFVRLENFKLQSTMRLRSRSGGYVGYPSDGPERLADATDVVEGLSPVKKVLKRLVLDFGTVHKAQDSFRLLPSMKHFTALRTLHVTQGELGRLLDHERQNLSETLPKFIEELFIKDFDEYSRKVVLDLAKRVSAGQYPNFKHLRLLGKKKDFMEGDSFLALMRIQEHLQHGGEGGGGGLDSTDAQTDELQSDEEGDDEEGDQEESEDSDPDALSSIFSDRMTFRQLWVEVCHRCLSDNVLMSSIVPHVEEGSRISIRIALDSVPLRSKVRTLFSKANAKFECVGLVIRGSVDVWM